MKLPQIDPGTLPARQSVDPHTGAAILAPLADGTTYVTVPTDRVPHGAGYSNRTESGTITRSHAHAAVMQAYGTGYTVTGAVGMYHTGGTVHRVYRMRRIDY